jgi:hypothetical protein
VALLDGQLDLLPTPGGGATFRVRFPACELAAARRPRQPAAAFAASPQTYRSDRPSGIGGLSR